MFELLIEFGLVFIFNLDYLTMGVGSELSFIGVDVSGSEVLEIVTSTVFHLFTTREVNSQEEL